MSVNDNKNSAYDLGGAAYEQVVERASNVFEHEKQRHLKTNEAEIARLKVRQIRLDEREKELRKAVEQAPDGDPSSLRWKWWRNIVIAAVLVVAGVIFAYIAIQPFGLGW